jgi:hypothetical protein
MVMISLQRVYATGRSAGNQPISFAAIPFLIKSSRKQPRERQALRADLLSRLKAATYNDPTLMIAGEIGTRREIPRREENRFTPSE